MNSYLEVTIETIKELALPKDYNFPFKLGYVTPMGVTYGKNKTEQTNSNKNDVLPYTTSQKIMTPL